MLEGSGEIGEYTLCRYHREAIARKDWKTVTILEETLING